jgi:glycosyltransferase involved in cell wall biosynthesis
MNRAEASVRILLLSQFYPPIVGGEERHVRNLAAALVQRGHRVAVATLWFPGADAVEHDGEVTVYRLRGTLQRLSWLFAESERRHAPPFPDPELVLGLKRVVAKEQPDVVHAHNWLVTSFLPIKRRYRLPLVVTMHDYGLVCAKKNLMRDGALCAGPGLAKCLTCSASHYGAIKGAITTIGNIASGLLLRRVADMFIPVSRAVARHTGLARARVPFEVIHNFVPNDIGATDATADDPQPDLPDGDYVLFVGDVMQLKGVGVLLKAYASLKGAPPLVLIGRRCADAPKELPPNVRLLAPRPHAAVMQAWRRCLFGVVPSTGPEACATVVMEAMACGKALIGTDIGGTPDLIDDGATGLLVPPGDSEALARAMKHLLDRPQLRADLGAAGLARVESLKARAIVARIERVYEHVIRAGTRTESEARRASFVSGGRS